MHLRGNTHVWHCRQEVGLGDALAVLAVSFGMQTEDIYILQQGLVIDMSSAVRDLHAEFEVHGRLVGRGCCYGVFGPLVHASPDTIRLQDVYLDPLGTQQPSGHPPALCEVRNGGGPPCAPSNDKVPGVHDVRWSCSSLNYLWGFLFKIIKRAIGMMVELVTQHAHQVNGAKSRSTSSSLISGPLVLMLRCVLRHSYVYSGVRRWTTNAADILVAHTNWQRRR